MRSALMLSSRRSELTRDVTKPALAHHLLAELRLPVYITTNYDSLFEDAWRSRWKTEPVVVTTDADVVALGLDYDTTFPIGNPKSGWRPVVIKMHGDAGSEIPQLILTRSDYRRHYRANSKLFELIKDLMRSSVVFSWALAIATPKSHGSLTTWFSASRVATTIRCRDRFSVCSSTCGSERRRCSLPAVSWPFVHRLC